jgi:hypothetical protein
MPESGTAKATPLPRLSVLMPNLFQTLRPTFDGDAPLIMAGSIFLMNDVHIVPMVTGPHPKLQGAFGGYALLKKIAESTPKDYYNLLWSPGRYCVVKIGTCRFEDSLDTLLRLFEATRFGNARVDRSGGFILISLADIVELLRNGSLESGMSASEVGSAIIRISPNASMKEAIDKMLAHRVRRLFIDGQGSAFVSDRSIISFMFSGERIYLVRNNSEQWIDAKVSDTKFGVAPTIAAGEPLPGAARVFGIQPDACLLTDDDKVVSRWDMIMKPWKAGDLAPRAADSHRSPS